MALTWIHNYYNSDQLLWLWTCSGCKVSGTNVIIIAIVCKCAEYKTTHCNSM